MLQNNRAMHEPCKPLAEHDARLNVTDVVASFTVPDHALRHCKFTDQEYIEASIREETNRMDMDDWFQDFMGSEDEDQNYELHLGNVRRSAPLSSPDREPKGPGRPETASKTESEQHLKKHPKQRVKHEAV